MPTYRVHFKSKAGDQFMLIDAPDREKAKQEANRAQHRRHERFPLTFSRLDQSLETGELHPMLAVDPRLQNMAGPELKAVLKAEVEWRKRDQGRYDDGDLKIASVKEVQ